MIHLVRQARMAVQTMERLKVLIVDDNEILLQTMVQVLSNNPTVELVWCVKSGEAALGIGAVNEARPGPDGH
jgi:CheY-like chemotaxis protein